MKTEKKEVKEIDVLRIVSGTVTYCVLGTRPLLMNRFAEKARQQILMPGRKKTQAERIFSLKHNVPYEFENSMYRTLDEKRKTRMVFPGRAFAQALADTALDIPGANKTQIQRLAGVTDVDIPIFGVPWLHMAMVRTADQKRTPDIRTRAIFPEWACYVTISFVKGLLTERSITNLFGAAGIICGIGDDRKQKGGDKGLFNCVENTNPDFQRIIKTQGTKAQDEGIKAMVPFDHDTEDLYAWYKSEILNREMSTKGDIVPLVRGNGSKRSGELVASR
jgi:hypothetical protein